MVLVITFIIFSGIIWYTLYILEGPLDLVLFHMLINFNLQYTFWEILMRLWNMIYDISNFIIVIILGLGAHPLFEFMSQPWCRGAAIGLAHT